MLALWKHQGEVIALQDRTKSSTENHKEMNNKTISLRPVEIRRARTFSSSTGLAVFPYWNGDIR
jgi:hypothetical protein